ncbi:unannotated protein [freshwater metagenome]|uniref:Unannotated protein n=1 Tax=freshwater metagenome TaxID=449393 RepID=A0A6J6XXM3_9ZZZZ
MILYLLHARTSLNGAGHNGVLRWVLQFDSIGLGQSISRHVIGDGRILKLLLETCKRFLLTFVKDRLDLWQRLQVLAQLRALGRCDVLGAAAGGINAGRRIALIATQENRNLNFVVPKVLHRADLRTH